MKKLSLGSVTMLHGFRFNRRAPGFSSGPEISEPSSERVLQDWAVRLGEILTARDLPSTTSLHELAAGADEATALFLRCCLRYPSDREGAEALYGHIQWTLMQQEAEMVFPGLRRGTFAGTITSPQQGGRLVVLVHPFGDSGSVLLHEIKTAADRRGWHTVSPSGPYWVPGSEAVEPQKLRERLRQLARTPHRMVAVLIDRYEEFELLPDAVKVLKQAERLGQRVFVASVDYTKAMQRDPSFPRRTHIVMDNDQSVREVRPGQLPFDCRPIRRKTPWAIRALSQWGRSRGAALRSA